MKTADDFYLGRPVDMDALDIELADRSLHQFMRVAWHVINPLEPFEDNWHIGCICEHLQAMTAGQIYKLVINIPPRHLKSMIASVFWFPWAWLRDPSSNWIFGSYDLKKLGERDSTFCRDIIRSKWYRDNFDIKWNIRDDMDQKDSFANTMGGTRIATTPGGVGTGLNAKYLVIDDLHNVRDAYRPQAMADDFAWFQKQMRTRGVFLPEYRELLIGQRIGEGDVYHRLKSEAMGFETLVLPLHGDPVRIYFTPELAKASGDENAIAMTTLQQANPSTRDTRKAGEVIHPNRFPPKVVKDLEASLGQDAAAQLEQKTKALKGKVFDTGNLRKFSLMFSRRYEEKVVVLYRDAVDMSKREVIPLSKCRCFQVADTAMTGKETSSFTAVGTFVLTPLADLLVWHMFQAHLEVGYQYTAIKKLKRGPVAWDPETRTFIEDPVPWPISVMFQAVEAKASGSGLIDQSKLDASNFVPVPFSSAGKIERAATVATMLVNGKVFVKEDGDWRPAFENQISQFPKSPKNDMVDVFAHAGILTVKDQLLNAFLNFDTGMMATAAEAAGMVPEPGEFGTIPGDKFTVAVGAGKVDVFFPDD